MCDCKILMEGLWEDSVGTSKNSQKHLATEALIQNQCKLQEYMYTSPWKVIVKFKGDGGYNSQTLHRKE